MTNAVRVWPPRIDALTEAHYSIMEAAINGCDFYLSSDARLVREVQAFDPDLITVTKPMGDSPVSQRQPYLGAILTGKGQQVLREHQQQKGEVL